MYARVATFESDSADIDAAIEMVRRDVAGDTPAGLEGAKMLMLVNRESGKGLGVTLFDSEEAMRRGDEALNAMNPGAGERRIAVEFYEVPILRHRCARVCGAGNSVLDDNRRRCSARLS